MNGGRKGQTCAIAENERFDHLQRQIEQLIACLMQSDQVTLHSNRLKRMMKQMRMQKMMLKRRMKQIRAREALMKERHMAMISGKVPKNQHLQRRVSVIFKKYNAKTSVTSPNSLHAGSICCKTAQDEGRSTVVGQLVRNHPSPTTSFHFWNVIIIAFKLTL